MDEKVVTSTDVQTAVMQLLRDSSVPSYLSGKILRAGMRTQDSRAEDLTISVTALDAEQRQGGFVRLTAYIPHLSEVPDLRRCAEVERLLTDWATGLSAEGTGDYLFRLASGVSSLVSLDRPESLVTARLSFRIAR